MCNLFQIFILLALAAIAGVQCDVSHLGYNYPQPNRNYLPDTTTVRITTTPRPTTTTPRPTTRPTYLPPPPPTTTRPTTTTRRPTTNPPTYLPPVTGRPRSTPGPTYLPLPTQVYTTRKPVPIKTCQNGGYGPSCEIAAVPIYHCKNGGVGKDCYVPVYKPIPHITRIPVFRTTTTTTTTPSYPRIVPGNQLRLPSFNTL